MNTPLTRLNISARLRNICERNEIETIGELLSLPHYQLSRLRGIGRGTLDEINILRDKYTGKDTTKTTFELLMEEREKAINGQWIATRDMLPALNGDFSEYVLCYDGEPHIAHFDRYVGWVTKLGEQITPTHWMKIPRL